MSPRVRFLLVSAAIYVAAVACVAATSWSTGPAFAEVERIEAISRAGPLISRVATDGVGALYDGAARKIHRSLAIHGTAPSLVGAWLWLAAKEVGSFDLLTALRMPFVWLTATLPLSLFWLAERGLGLRIGLLGAVVLLGQSWFLHGAAVGSNDAVVASAWLLVLACHVRALVVAADAPRRPRIRWSAAASVALAVGMAFDLATLWVVVPILVHTAVVHRRYLRRAVGRGRLPVPAAVLFALVVTPALFAGCAPDLWGRNPSGLVRAVFAPLDRKGPEVVYLGQGYDTPPFPVEYALHWLVAQVPLLMLVLAMAGVVLWMRARVTGRRRDATGVGVAMVLFVVGALVGNVVVPPVFASFPPRVFAAGAFLSLAAAVAIDDGLSLVLQRFRVPVLVLVGGVLCIASTADLATRGGGFGVLVGGTSSVLDRRTFEPDGSELAAVVPLARAQRIRGVHVDGAPAAYGRALDLVSRRDGVEWVARPRRGVARVVRGPDPEAVARVTHRGAILWSLIASD